MKKFIILVLCFFIFTAGFVFSAEKRGVDLFLGWEVGSSMFCEGTAIVGVELGKLVINADAGYSGIGLKDPSGSYNLEGLEDGIVVGEESGELIPEGIGIDIHGSSTTFGAGVAWKFIDVPGVNVSAGLSAMMTLLNGEMSFDRVDGDFKTNVSANVNMNIMEIVPEVACSIKLKETPVVDVNLFGKVGVAFATMSSIEANASMKQEDLGGSMEINGGIEFDSGLWVTKAKASIGATINF